MFVAQNRRYTLLVFEGFCEAEQKINYGDIFKGFEYS